MIDFRHIKCYGTSAQWVVASMSHFANKAKSKARLAFIQEFIVLEFRPTDGQYPGADITRIAAQTNCPTIVIPMREWIRFRTFSEFHEATTSEILIDGIFGTWGNFNVTVVNDRNTAAVASMCSKTTTEIHTHEREAYEKFWINVHDRVVYAQAHKEMNGKRCIIQPENIKGRILSSLSPKAVLVETNNECVIANLDRLKLFYL